MTLYVQEGKEMDTIAGHVEMDMIAEYASVPIDLKRDNTSKPSEVWIISFEIVFKLFPVQNDFICTGGQGDGHDC